MYDDSAQEIEFVLGTLYDRNFYIEREKPFPLVAAMLRIGKKYDFAELRKDAVMRLEASFPPTLAGFKSRANRSRIVQYPWLVCDVINLAGKTGILSIYPPPLFSLRIPRQPGLYPEQRSKWFTGCR
ncbi:hypothetical protein K438DRAFT_1972748 [Mycena galopus ATCC 62051]|nr:hypothetical protein K438DRAFT_1972748 [Mycena galopus ATCC 62051]